jgi:hypothetical protein
MSQTFRLTTALISCFLLVSMAQAAGPLTVSGILQVNQQGQKVLSVGGLISHLYPLTGSLTDKLIQNQRYILKLKPDASQANQFQVTSGQRIYRLTGLLSDKSSPYSFETIKGKRVQLKGPGAQNWKMIKVQLPDQDYSKTYLSIQVASGLEKLELKADWLEWQIVPEVGCFLEGKPVVFAANKIKSDGSKLEAFVEANVAGQRMLVSQGYCQKDVSKEFAYDCRLKQGETVYGTTRIEKPEDYEDGDNLTVVIHRTDEAQTELPFQCSVFDFNMLQSEE